MPVFEVEAGGKVFEVDAPSVDAALSAVSKKNQIGPTEAFARGLKQGATFNFGDELAGVAAAGGADPNMPPSEGAARLPMNILVGAYKLLASGDPEAKKLYEQASSADRSANERAQQERPYSSVAGQLAGGVALPVAGLLNAATLPMRMARGAGVGAGAGALYGAGEGEEAADRIAKAATGGTVGAAVGGVAPAVLAGIGAAGKKIAEPVANKIRGIVDPDAEASRRALVQLQKDAQSGGGLTPQEFLGARTQGTPVAIMDMGDEGTRALARSAANTSPEARAALERTTMDRFGSQGARTVDFVQSLVRTPANAGVTREALEQAARTARRPFYERAYAQGRNGIWDNDLEALGQSPVMQQAIKDAATSIGNKTATGRAMSPLSPDGKPTLEFWDQVKRSLDSRHKVLKRQGDSEAAGDIDLIRKTLVHKLDQAVPEYATARGVASELFKASDALEAGEKFVKMNVGLGEVRSALAKMSPEERDLFREGFISRLIEDINATGDRRSVLNKINGSVTAREKLDLALGREGAAKLEAFIRVENIMDRARGAVSGNSTTARQLMEAGLAGGALGAYQTGDLANPVNLFYALVGAGARYGGIKINQRLTQRVGEMLASDDLRVIEKGLKIVANSKPMMQTLRSADDYAAKLIGQQAPKALTAQSVTAPRAEDNKPDVQRPRGQ